MALEHDFDWQTDFCKGCGLSAIDWLDNAWQGSCPNDDQKKYLVARFQRDAMVRPLMERMGLVKPEVFN